jgi:hypothetical protein
MSAAFHLSLSQVLLYIGAWIVLDAIKAACGHAVDWKPVFFVVFFSAGLLALGFSAYWKAFLP